MLGAWLSQPVFLCGWIPEKCPKTAKCAAGVFNVCQLERLMAHELNDTYPVRPPSICALLAQAIDSAGDAILIIDANDRVVWANRAFARLSGFQPHEVIGEHCATLRAQTSPADCYSALRHSQPSHMGTWQRELCSVRRDGTTYIADEIVTPLWDQGGKLTHFVAVLHDVTRSKEALQKERLLASQDMLTGLAGRARVTELLTSAIAEAQQSGRILSVLFVDLDGFKKINDSHGHSVGDAVLKAVASRLQSVIRCSDTVARFGGDEFVILLPTVASRRVARRIGMHAVDQLSQPFAVGIGRHSLSASVGLAFFPEHGRSSESLLNSADEAMYRAKRQGGSQFQVADLAAEPMHHGRFREISAVEHSADLNGSHTDERGNPGTLVGG
ncbi:sensor domain-containing diguanylate cyclase [Massilia eurypsychrophila]|uniref:Sensor domain-containing diguanylate cyclase n=2 Tax=Massilia eurypsychrophila TaxID=1485217 RepID=A0A2G8T9S5_9BURK|nr:sensor domain-containing diguanylate cyclase [Massilia eurypsychrophila]